MTPGFLVVFSEPEEKVTLEEFQDWYDNEHIPLRLNYLPSFLSGARFSAADSQSPSWLALYEVDDTSTFQHDSYTRLRTNRSDREEKLVGRLAILDRRTCAVVSDTGEGAVLNENTRTGLKADQPSEVLVTYDIEVNAEGNLKQWFTEMVDKVKDLDCWVRSRLVEVIDSGKTGLKVSQDDESTVTKYLGVHEFTRACEISVIQEKMRAEDGIIELMNFRQWGLYRAYPCLAQGNLEK